MKPNERKKNEAKYKLRRFKTIGDILNHFHRKKAIDSQEDGIIKKLYVKKQKLPKGIKRPLLS